MSSQRLTQSEVTTKLKKLCYCIQREVRGPYLLELLVLQLVMSTIAHANNKIMWTNENNVQGEQFNGVELITLSPLLLLQRRQALIKGF